MRMKRKGWLFLVLGLVFLVQAGGVAWSQVTERLSVDSAGSDANGASDNPSTSSDGRYVAFESGATDLVPVGSNGLIQVFVRDRQTGTTAQVSVDSGGNEGDRPSNDPSISADGRYVAFESQADNLIVGDTNLFPFADLLLHDRQTGNTTLVSVDSNGVQGDGPSSSPSISADGRYVAFESEADLVNGDVSFHDIFVRDQMADTTTLVSVDSIGIKGNNDSYAPSISTDGRYVAFESSATNLVPGGSNGSIHIFVHDRDADGDGIYDDEDGNYDPGEVSTAQVSVDSVGAEAIGGDSSSCSISGDGRYVAFVSDATNLVPGGSNGSIHIFVHDRDADGDGIYDDEDGNYDPGEVSTAQVSVDSVGDEGDNNSNFPSISSDGRYVAFESLSTNLVAGDTLGFSDVFVHDLQTGATTRVSVDLAGVEGNGSSNNPSISADGSSVTFQSDADNLVGVGNDKNMAPDIFVDGLQTGAGGGGGGGSSSGGGGCFIATAADGSGMAGEK